MRVFLLDPKSIEPQSGELQRAAFREFEHISQLNGNRDDSVVQQVEGADVILAPIQFNGYGLFFRKLKQSEFYRRHRSRIYVYCPDDNVYPAIPGVYPSVRSRFVRANWARPGHYLSSHILKFDFSPDLLARKDIECSFAGSTYTHPVRKEIAALEAKGVLVFDSSTSAQAPWYSQAASLVENTRMRFREILERSQFTICPRGAAPSSIRLFEAMQASCIPIIVSDHQVLPEGPDWDACSIRVKEKEVACIPERVADHRARASEMGTAARHYWETYFSPETGFQTVCKAIESIHLSLEPVRSQCEFGIAVSKYWDGANIRSICRDWKSRLRRSSGER